MHVPLTQPLHAVNPATRPVGTKAWQGPLFVVGIWRSGTSLLYALLNQHPRIALMYEGDLAHLHSLFWVRRSSSFWLNKWEHWNRALTRHRFHIDRIPAGRFDLKTAIETAYVQYARQSKRAEDI